jgi:hypothetical protein
MAYILTAERHATLTGAEALAQYAAYLADVRDRMPPGAFALATSGWYFNPSDHRCPHDAWLDSCQLEEVTGPSLHNRRLDLTVRLLGAYHDGYLILRYTDVTRYRLDFQPTPQDTGHGHRDWRYDEFRAVGSRRVEHEIEWWGTACTGTWLIEAADVEASWVAAAPTP